MNVLMVRLSAFGDMIHCLPAMEDLLASPKVNEVHWLVDRRYAFVSELFPAAVQAHCIDLKGKGGMRATLETVHALRKLDFSCVLDLQGLMKSALLARAIGTQVYGIDRQHVREKPAAMLQHSVPFCDEERHVVQQYRKVAHAAITDGNGTACVMDYVLPQVRGDVLQAMQPPASVVALTEALGAFIVLHAAGGWQTKQLPATTWIDLARAIQAQGKRVIFSWGSEQERQQAVQLAEQSGAQSLPERLNMSALCHLLGHADAVIGADTGLLHLAAALGRCTVTFWGPSASWRSGPIGEQHWHIESNPSCGPCFKRTCDHFVCMDDIRVSAIMEALHESANI